MLNFMFQAGELEQLDQEIEIALQGLGLSLVNNDIRKEIAFMGITRYVRVLDNNTSPLGSGQSGSC